MTDSTSLSSSSSRVWLITGASSGLGLALLLRILSRTTHDRVIATVRVPAKLESALDSRLSQVTDLGENAPRSTSTFASLVEAGRLMALKMDVTESWDDIKAKIQDAIGRWAGRKLDVLVNNAGVGIAGLSEEGGAQVMLEQMKINLFGVINVTNAVLPYMRARREGTIFIVGSRSAWRNERPGIAFYAASKAAVHSYGETLSAELRHFNICVTIIAPGSFHTSARFDLSSPAGVLVADYTVTREKMAELQRQRSKRLEETGGRDKSDPERGMDIVVDLVLREGRSRELMASDEVGGNESGKEEWPLWLFLGKDGMDDLRKRTERIDNVMEDWAAVGSDVHFV